MHFFENAIVDIVWNNNIVSKKLKNIKIDLNENRLVGNDFYGFPIKVSLDNLLDIEEINDKQFGMGKNGSRQNRQVQSKIGSKRVQRKTIRKYK